MNWLEEVGSYFTSEFLWTGAVMAVQITVLSMTIGLLLGLGLALMRLSSIRAVSGLAWFYIWFVRGTPQLLQLVFIFDALPLVGLKFDSFTTAVIGFSLNQAAFAGEILRGGILAVNPQQSIAAASLGMGPALTLRRIVLPQAMRAILPALANDTIGMIKMTSVASVIFVNELTFRAQQIVGQNFKFFTVFAGAALIYLLLTSVISLAQLGFELYFNPERRRRSAGETPARYLWSLVGAGGGRSPPPAAAAAPRTGGTDLARFIAPPGDGDGRAGPFVACRDVWKAYGGRDILKSLDIKVERGEVVVVIGPSGSGKSTLLRLINHLESVDKGEITVGGEHVGYRRAHGALRPIPNRARARAAAGISMVFQQFNLFAHLTALENVIEAPIRVHGVPRQEAEDMGRALLALVGLGGHADRLPHHLSGGQQQRVAIARGLALKPRLMLFDEPTSALDPELVGEVLAVMRTLAAAGMTMIVVTHEIRFAREVADRVVFVDEGAVVEAGSPAEVLDRPRQERTRRFLSLLGGEATGPAAPDSGAPDPATPAAPAASMALSQG